MAKQYKKKGKKRSTNAERLMNQYQQKQNEQTKQGEAAVQLQPQQKKELLTGKMGAETKNESLGEVISIVEHAKTVAGGKRTIILVDFENWFYSLRNHYNIKPNVQGFLESVMNDIELVELNFYADFSNDVIREEFWRIRSFTNSIIDTRPPEHKAGKEHTDFVILDEIYQLCVRHSDIDQLIIVTGDGHFTSAVNFVKTFCCIDVVIYAVQGCLDTSLSRAATKIVLLPDTYDYLLLYAKELLLEMRTVIDRQPWFNFHFRSLVNQVNVKRGLNKQLLTDALEVLINEGYVHRETQLIKGSDKTVIVAKWEKIYNDGIIDRPESEHGATLAKAQREYERNGYAQRNGNEHPILNRYIAEMEEGLKERQEATG